MGEEQLRVDVMVASGQTPQTPEEGLGSTEEAGKAQGRSRQPRERTNSSRRHMWILGLWELSGFPSGDQVDGLPLAPSNTRAVC